MVRCLAMILFVGMLGASAADGLAAALSDLLPEFSEQSLPFRPEWNTLVVDTWDGGVPKEILLCTPDRQWPMKQLSFYPSGAIAQESDLLPYQGSDEGRGVKDGACLSYYETGSPLRVRSYARGQLNGEERGFDERGGTLYEALYRDGKLDGAFTTFWPSGGVCIAEQYVDGLLHGHRSSFYEIGERESEAVFVRGRLEGKRFVWGQKGEVRELTTWKNGLLHDESPEIPAKTVYWDDGQVRERQSFLRDSPMDGSNRIIKTELKRQRFSTALALGKGFRRFFLKTGLELAGGSLSMGRQRTLLSRPALMAQWRSPAGTRLPDAV